jgi:transcriptional regulator with XRE-family HTH domain
LGADFYNYLLHIHVKRMTSAQLRELRLSAHLSQGDLAAALRISASAISQAERGLTQLTDEHAEAARKFVKHHRRFLEKIAELALNDDPTNLGTVLRGPRSSSRG